MQRFALPIAIIAMFVLVGLTFTTTALGQGDGDEDPIQEDVVRDLYDESGQIRKPDDRLAKIARAHEGGFGGYFFEGGVAYVYMLDPTQVEAAESAFREAHEGGRRLVNRVVPIQGQYAFSDLVRWFGLLDNAVAEEGIWIRTSAVMEIQNRVVLGMDDISQADQVRQLMEDLDIPPRAVVLHASKAELLGNGDNVDAKWRPG